MLSGHTDVVPVDGQQWDSDPWQAVEVGDRLVGRGVCDMKSFIAIALALVPEMVEAQARATAAFRAVVRRGGGLHRRAPADRRPRQCRLCSGRLHRRRTHRHGARRRAQGQALVPLPRPRLRSAFGADAQWRQRGRDRLRDRRVPARHGEALSRATAASIATTTCRSRRFTSARSRAARRSTSCRAIASSGSSSGICRSTIPIACCARCRTYAERFLPEMHAVAPDTGITFEELSALPGFDTGADSAIAELGRCCNHGTVVQQGLLRRRGVAVPQRGHSRHPVRPRPHRAGPPAERVGDARAGGAVRDVPAAAHRPR